MTTRAHDAFAGWAEGALPSWAVMSPRRRAHVERVAALMDRWAAALGLDERERTRWRTAGWMHDALRDAPADVLRAVLVDPDMRALPDPFMHGPAAAERMAADGYDDVEVLDAVRYHTLGDARLGRLGLALIAADALEPGRDSRAEWRGELRNRLPHAFDDVVREVVGARITDAVERVSPLRPELIVLWNQLAADARAH